MSKSDFHYLIGENFVDLCGVESVKEIYDSLKAAKFFCAFHSGDAGGEQPEVDKSDVDDATETPSIPIRTMGPHIHLVSTIATVRKNQKLPQTMAKISPRLPNISPNFNELLKRVATPVPTSAREREQWAFNFVNERGACHNAMSLDPTQFQKLAAHICSNPSPNLKKSSCMSGIPCEVQLHAGIRDMSEQEEDQDMDIDVPSGDQDVPDSTVKMETKSKIDKWTLVQSILVSTDARNMKELTLRMTPDQWKYVYLYIYE